jgi:dTDP-4-amino-4,6-dideoxygalactose transaminase
VELSGHFAFPILVSDLATRDAVRESMHAQRVQTTFYPSLTQLSVYLPKSAGDERPIAEEIANRHLALPLSPSLDDEQITTVINALEHALQTI